MTALAFICIGLLFLLSFKYPSIAVGMYLTAGFIKTILVIYIPIFRGLDYTVLCAFLLLIIMLFYFFKNRGKLSSLMNVPVVVFLLLCLVLLLGATYTSAPIYGWEKSLRVTVLGSIALLSPLCFILQVQRLKEFIVILFVVGLIISIGTVIAPHAGVYREGAEWRGSFLEADPLESATRVAVALIIAFYFCILSESTLKTKILMLFLMPFMLLAIILTGSRGPFLGVFISFAAAFIIARKKLSRASFPLAFIVVIAAVVYMFVKLPEEQTHRIANLFKSRYETGEAVETRTGPFGWVLKNSWKSPVWGNGTGAFAMDYAQVDRREYPHNVFLELLYENGIIGVVLLLMFLWLVFKRWLIARSYADVGFPIQTVNIVGLLGLLFLYNFLQSMKSSDIDGNRFFFFTCGLILAAHRAMGNSNEYEATLDYAMPEFGYQT
jgi:O-antigen ligase